MAYKSVLCESPMLSEVSGGLAFVISLSPVERRAAFKCLFCSSAGLIISICFQLSGSTHGRLHTTHFRSLCSDPIRISLANSDSEKRIVCLCARLYCYTIILLIVDIKYRRVKVRQWTLFGEEKFQCIILYAGLLIHFGSFIIFCGSN